MVRFETVRKMALALPETTEALSYGTPAFFVHGKFFARLREDGTLGIKATELDRRALAALEPETYEIPKHYENYAMLAVHLDNAERRALNGLLIQAWRIAAPKKLVAAFDSPPRVKTSTERK